MPKISAFQGMYLLRCIQCKSFWGCVYWMVENYNKASKQYKERFASVMRRG